MTGAAGTPRAGAAPPYLDTDAVAALGFDAAADAIAAALRGGLDAAADPPRAAIDVTAGQLLLMPAEVPGFAGVKMAAVAPANPAAGLPRIQASYLLLDGSTLAPLALVDGTALTTLRTPAVSAVAARALAPTGPCRLVIFGAGPQAAGHLEALSSVREIGEVLVVARTAQRAEALAAAARERHHLDARAARAPAAGSAAGEAAGIADPGAPAAGAEVTDALALADIVVCATTASRPLFDAGAVRPGALVIAVGSHRPDVLELDPALLARSQVVVEDPATALREAGEVVTAAARGLLDPRHLVGLADLVSGGVTADPGRTRVFKSVGMGWEDLVVAVGVFRRHRRGGDGG